MSIKVSPVTPVKKFLLRSDPSEDTWVMIKPITYRDDMLRGEVLREQEWASTMSGEAKSSGLNMYRLRAEELWITYHSAHIVIEDEDGNTREPFKPRDEMTRQAFMDALADLPTNVVLEWHEKMVEVNPDWRFPF